MKFKAPIETGAQTIVTPNISDTFSNMCFAKITCERVLNKKNHLTVVIYSDFEIR